MHKRPIELGVYVKSLAKAGDKEREEVEEMNTLK